MSARVLGDVKGPKVRIGKYKKRTGYRRHTGFRASLTQIQIESIGAKKRAAAKPAQDKKERAPAKAVESERPKGMPAGYEEMTVAQIKAAVSDWSTPMLAAALEYEQARGKRKGALAAIESAIAAKEEAS